MAILTKEQFRERLLAACKRRQNEKRRMKENLINGYWVDTVEKSRKQGRRGNK